MKKLILLGAVMTLIVTALSSAAGAADTAVTAEDAKDVVAAEAYFFADEKAEAESIYPEHIVKAAEKRYEFETLEDGALIDGAWWMKLIGEDTFGGISLGIDGTVTIEYVGKQPAEKLLPDGFEYKFVEVKQTLKEASEVDEYIDTGALTSLPNASHHRLMAGQAITVSCGNDTSSGEEGWPLYRTSAKLGTKTVGVTFIENGTRAYGYVTAGHVVHGAPGCGTSGKHFNSHMWTGWQSFPLFAFYKFDDSDAWWNAEGPNFNGGRDAGGRTSYFKFTSDLDLAIVKVKNKIDDLRRAHLGPYRGTGTDPWSANHGWFYRIIEYPTDGLTHCVSRTQTVGGIEPGVDCGQLVKENTNTYHLDVSSGKQAEGGESGTPIFTRHTKPYVAGISTNSGGTYNGNNYEFKVRRLWDQLVRMENAYSELSGIEMCGTNPTSSTISDRTHYCG